MNTWQLCPKCNGEKGYYGTLNLTKFGYETCKICAGAGIISTLTGLPPANTHTPVVSTQNCKVELQVGNAKTILVDKDDPRLLQ
ncbi:hypothetical protein AHMF7605_11610 [Adhaeribacter arboris]|uniref:Uncharacterized protein n=1 Tax=Adhaeribacter arboris TaxID=2072846 RepID=A0A2T2YF78_9BACT|nr:hypothetical protein AHMF7605_11610 [Adhaeribacter arboris]